MNSYFIEEDDEEQKECFSFLEMKKEFLLRCSIISVHCECA